MKKYGLLLAFLLMGASLWAKDYNASLFGIKSDGRTNNTASIQKAIDYINSQGGGTLVFYVGRYLTGTVELKSNVCIRLEEGAVLLGSASPYDYKSLDGVPAIIVADGQSNIGLSGKGVVEGAGSLLVANTDTLVQKGYVEKDTKPALIAFSNCINIELRHLNLWNAAYTALNLTKCRNIALKDLDINGQNLPSSAGIYLTGCAWVTLRDLFIRVKQQALTTVDNENIYIRDSMNDTGALLSGS